MKKIFDKTNIGNIAVKNRFVRSATWEELADNKGHMTEPLFQVYENLAKGGVGTIITGYAYVLKDEQPNPGMMGIYDDSFIEEYKKLTDMVHQFDTKIVLQIVYGGSQTRFNVGERVIWGPSAVENTASKVVPTTMTKEDIKQLIEAFAQAALRAKMAGFDGVQMHGAHGYLLSQFLNPYYNSRTDEYGGSIESRARIVFEVYQAIREKVGKDYPVWIKINCSDFMDNGLTLEDSKYVCKTLTDLGIDAIEISGGNESSRRNEGPVRSKINSPEQESYFYQHADAIDAYVTDRGVNVPIILVGGNRSIEKMEEILNNSNIQFFSMARPFLREPDLINRWQSGDREKAKCISCNKCFMVVGKVCKFNRSESV